MKAPCKIRGGFYESPYPRHKGGITNKKRIPKRPRSEHGKPALTEIVPIIGEKANYSFFMLFQFPYDLLPPRLCRHSLTRDPKGFFRLTDSFGLDAFTVRM